MNIVRLIIILLVVALLYQLVRRFLYKPDQPEQNSKARIGTMVRCVHCGLHVPREEAVEGEKGYYCSSEHLQIEGDKQA